LLAVSLVFAGRPTTREPWSVGQETAWYHIGIPPDEAHPVRAALDVATLRAGGGDVIYPGSSADLYGLGIWLDAPKDGGMPFVWVEQRESQTYLHVDPLGQLRSVVGAKVALHPLEPRTWQNLSTSVSGMIAWRVRAEGGKVWIGTHNDTRLTPYETNPVSGLSWPLEDGESTPWLPGNPVLNAWSDEPGAQVRFWKLLRGRNW
jgi:hypothetical protein